MKTLLLTMNEFSKCQLLYYHYTKGFGKSSRNRVLKNIEVTFILKLNLKIPWEKYKIKNEVGCSKCYRYTLRSIKRRYKVQDHFKLKVVENSSVAHQIYQNYQYMGNRSRKLTGHAYKHVSRRFKRWFCI